MKQIQIERRVIKGLAVRTKNSHEINLNTAKIAPLWQEFGKQFSWVFAKDQPMYGVYYDYESDANGEFTVLAGLEDQNIKETLTSTQISLNEGNYLVFKKEGKMPDAVIEAWNEVWSFFSSNKCEFERAYKTDFEYYKNQSEIEVFIGIK